MSRKKKGQGNFIVLPPWFIAPVIFVGIPLLFVLYLIYPRPINYNYIPLPSLKNLDYNYIQLLIKKSKEFEREIKDSDSYLIEAFEDENIAEYNEFKKIPVYNRAHIIGKLKLRVRETLSRYGIKHYERLGYYLALKFIMALKDLESEKNRIEIIKLSGSFIEKAKRAGLIIENRFVAPLGIAGVLFKIRWLNYSNEDYNNFLTSEELIFLSIFKVKYKKKGVLKERLQALSIICSRWKEYPCNLTKAVIYSNYGLKDKAKQTLILELLKDPFNIRARNFFYYLSR